MFKLRRFALLPSFILLLSVLASAICATAQQAATTAPPEGSNWQHVQALPAGTSINVEARSSHITCKLKSVDTDTLTCTQKKNLIFQRADILTIKIPHRGRSALIGTAIGGGVGAGIGFAAGTNNNGGWFGPNFLRGAVTGIGAVFGGIVGGGTGAVTDFSRSTVYKAP